MGQIDISEILRKPEFDELPPNVKKELVKVSHSIENKSGLESYRIISEFYNNFLKNYPMTKTSQKAIYMAITSSLSDSDRKQFDILYKTVLSKM